MTQFEQSRLVCNFCGKSIIYEYSMDQPVTHDEFTKITGFVIDCIVVPPNKREDFGAFINVHACDNPVCRKLISKLPDVNDYKAKEVGDDGSTS